MGLPIFDSPPTKHTSKSTTYPTGYSRSIIRRRRGQFDGEVSDSAARAIINERRHAVSSLHRTRTNYGSQETSDRLWSPSIQSPPAGGDDTVSASSSRPRSRRGLPSASAQPAEDDTFPPLRRMTGHSSLRSLEGTADAERPTTDIDGLGDRERSISAEPLPWSASSPLVRDTSYTPQSPPLSSFRSLLPTVPASRRSYSDLQRYALDGATPRVGQRSSTLLNVTGDPDSLFCEDPDHVPISNAREEPSEVSAHHREAVTMLRETADLIHQMEARLGNLHARDHHNEEILTIMHQLGDLARRVREHDETLLARLQNSVRDSEATMERSTARGAVSELGMYELGRL